MKESSPYTAWIKSPSTISCRDLWSMSGSQEKLYSTSHETINFINLSSGTHLHRATEPHYQIRQAGRAEASRLSKSPLSKIIEDTWLGRVGDRHRSEMLPEETRSSVIKELLVHFYTFLLVCLLFWNITEVSNIRYSWSSAWTLWHWELHKAPTGLLVWYLFPCP